MWPRLMCAAALFGIFAEQTPANTIWTGTASDSWFDAANWDNGVPHIAGERAQIESSTDLTNWPVIKNGETVNMGERIFLPQTPAAAGQTRYGRLTVQSGGVLNVDDDFRAGDDDGTVIQPMVGSFVVAGAVTFSDTARFGDNEFMTLTVNVTGTMTSTADDEEFRIGTGNDSNVAFNISGNGLVSVAGPFDMDDGGLLSIFDNGILTLFEHMVEEDDDVFVPFTKADIIDLISGFVDDGLIQGLTGSYSGGQALTQLGNGVAYYQGNDSVSFVSVPEPSTLLLMTLLAVAGFRHCRR